jgi:hypothetical protein
MGCEGDNLCTLQNHSLRESFLPGTPGAPENYVDLYDEMIRYQNEGERISFQTSQTSEVGNLASVLQWACDEGAYQVELANDYSLSDADVLRYDACLGDS